MIDIEYELYNEIYEAVMAEFPDVNMTSEYVREPSKFPSVSFVEVDNTTMAPAWSTHEEEEYASILYEVNIYSNKSVGKKSECRKIFNLIDQIMVKKNFNRNMCQPVPNMLDSTVYRLLGRYSGVVSKDKALYRR